MTSIKGIYCVVLFSVLLGVTISVPGRLNGTFPLFSKLNFTFLFSFYFSIFFLSFFFTFLLRNFLIVPLLPIGDKFSFCCFHEIFNFSLELNFTVYFRCGIIIIFENLNFAPSGSEKDKEGEILIWRQLKL